MLLLQMAYVEKRHTRAMLLPQMAYVEKNETSLHSRAQLTAEAFDCESTKGESRVVAVKYGPSDRFLNLLTLPIRLSYGTGPRTEKTIRYDSTPILDVFRDVRRTFDSPR